MFGGAEEILRGELEKSINSLEINQSFNIILFEETSDRMGFIALSRNPLPANATNKARGALFAQNIEVHGLGNPLPAFREAFSEVPQTICLITNGMFLDDAASVAKITADLAQRNHEHRVRVNVIMVESDEPPSGENDSYRQQNEAAMKEIASENGGTFRVLHPGDSKLFPEK